MCFSEIDQHYCIVTVAPEVIREMEYDEKVDVWSTAITMIEMMDRVPPLYYLDNTDDIFAEILWGMPAKFSFATPSEHMKDLVAWMLYTDIRRRPSAKKVLSVKNSSISRKLQFFIYF